MESLQNNTKLIQGQRFLQLTKKQFDSEIPTYKQYAEVVATIFANRFKNAERKPLLLIEPGSALVGDCMYFASRVVNIKEVRGKAIATLCGSIYNINPTLNYTINKTLN